MRVDPERARRLAIVVLSAAWLAAGCRERRTVRWELAFEDPAQRASSARMIAEVRAGGCDEDGERLYGAELAPGDAAPAVPTLREGTYAFAALARDAACVEIARGCADVTLPADPGATVRTVLRSTGGGAPACAACVAGRCEGELDAGPPDDAGADGGADDAGPPGPAAPRLVHPWNGFVTSRTQLRPVLRFRSVAGATRYVVETTATCAPGRPATCDFTGAATHERAESPSDLESLVPATPLAPASGARVVWRVRACDASACGPPSEARWMELGRSAHDVDGDGDGDLVIGAPSDDARASDAGAVILHRGSPSGPSASGERIDLGAAVPGGWAGVALDVGDLDGDGLADAIVGATSADPADTTSGFLLVLRGDRARGLVLAGAPIAAPDAAFARHFGESVAIVDDHDGDGFRDVLVGASRTSAPGRAYLFRGDPAAVIARAPIVIEDPDAASGARFGHVVAAARDVDGDGLADLLVGAPFADVGGSREAGRVHLFRAAAPGSPVAIDGPSDAYVYFGYALAGPGDVDGDGLSDVAIGAPFEDRRTDRVDPDEGQVYVLAGSASAPGLVRSPPLATLGRDTGYEYVHAGWSLAAGDVDGDGIVDLIVPEPGIDTSGSTTVDRGLVGFRRARGDGTFDATELLYPDSAVDFMQYGRSVAAIDLDGDGAAEIVGGAHRYRTNEGRAWWHRYPFASTTGTPIAPPTTSGAPRFGWALPASVGRWPVDLDP